MYTSLLIAGLAAASAYATPLNLRQATPSGFVTATRSSAAAPTTHGSDSWNNASSAAGYSVSAAAAAKPNPTAPAGFIGTLLTADNEVARFKDIQKEINNGDVSLVFDFNPGANPGVVPGAGGQVDLASRTQFPVLTDLGISSAAIFFEPCGLNTPHIHPRASEFLTLVTPTHMSTGFVLENGLTTEFNTTLTQYQGTVFPMGSIHFQQNLDCAPAVAIAGLNHEDPGASSIAQNFLVNTDSNVVDAALGFPSQIHGANFQQFKAHIPPPLALGVEECLVRCNIPH